MSGVAQPASAPKSLRDASVGGTLSDRNFQRLCTLVYRLSGIKLTEKKRSMIDGRLRRRLRALSMANINTYCDFLFGSSASAEAELVCFVDAVTTNKTDFFREPAHFVFMRRVIMPSWQAEGRRRVKVWSAACSIGAEAYTVAMVLDDYFRDLGGVDYTVLATDICTDVLERGNAALFPDSMLDPIPEELRRRYVLVPHDPRRREFRIAGRLRSRVSFRKLNLMDERYGFDRDFDLIFLRNVLIYFDRPTQEAVLSKLCEHLGPGGYLFLGHSESLAGTRLPIKMVANTIFQRQ